MGEEGERNEIYPYMKFLEVLISKIRQSTVAVKDRNKHLFILSCVVLTKCYGSYFITTAELLQRVKKTCSLHTHCMHYACLLFFPSNVSQHTLESSFLAWWKTHHTSLTVVWFQFGIVGTYYKTEHSNAWLSSIPSSYQHHCKSLLALFYKVGIIWGQI